MALIGAPAPADVVFVDGESFEGRIDTGVSVATKANMGEPDMAALLAPDLARWLDE